MSNVIPLMKKGEQWDNASPKLRSEYDHSLKLTHRTKLILDYADLIDALKEKRKALDLSQNELDDRAGIQDGYTGKVEAWRSRKYGRGLGPVTLPLVLEALGVCLVMVDRPQHARWPPGVRRKSKHHKAQLELDLHGGKNGEWPNGVNPFRRHDYQ